MKLRCKHGPHFLKRELGFLFGLGVAMAILFVHGDDAISSVLKMPKPLPGIVKSYKSVFVHAGRPGMNNSGVQVKQGDYITILAKGTMDLAPNFRGANAYGPKVLFLYKLSEEGSVQRYQGPEIIAIRESGNIYLGYNAKDNQFSPPTGFFYVDIIVWKTKDPNLIAKFLEEASLAQPKDKDLKEMAQEFKKRQEVLAGLQEKTKEVEEIKEELSALEAKEVSGIKKATKQELRDSTSPVVKMPQPLPDIVKSHKSVFVDAGRPGMNNSGVQVKEGDYITILAKGTIDLAPNFRGTYAYGPKVLLLYKLSEEGLCSHTKDLK